MLSLPISGIKRRLGIVRQHARRGVTAISDIIKDRLLDVQLALWPSTGRTLRPAPRAGLHILMVDDLVPDPLFGAGYPRAQAIVRSLVAAGHRVSFYPMESKRVDLKRMAAAFGASVRFYPGERAPGLARLLRRRPRDFDLLFVSRPDPMRALLDARRQMQRDQPPVIYDAEAVLAPREALRRMLFGSPWSEAEYRTMLIKELALANGAQAVTAVGARDAEIISSTTKLPVFMLPHSVSVRDDGPDFDDRKDFLFVGRLTGDRSLSPNVDSILWFATEIMPRIDTLIGTGYRLHIVGRIDADDVANLASTRIVLHGVVNDLQSLYDRCRVFVAPTRYAAGIPLKVIEAMSEGIPCVITPLLDQQLAARDEILATGDGAEDFSRRCANVYTDAAAWRDVRNAGVAYVRRTCSPAEFDRSLNDAVARVVGNG